MPREWKMEKTTCLYPDHKNKLKQLTFLFFPTKFFTDNFSNNIIYKRYTETMPTKK